VTLDEARSHADSRGHDVNIRKLVFRKSWKSSDLRNVDIVRVLASVLLPLFLSSPKLDVDDG